MLKILFLKAFNKIGFAKKKIENFSFANSHDSVNENWHLNPVSIKINQSIRQEPKNTKST